MKMNKDLENKAEELEQTLSKQLELLKVDSKEWVKIGGLVLAGGLLTYAIIRTSKKKKDRETDRAIEVLEREGLLTKDLEKKLTEPQKSSFWPSLSQRLLILGLAIAKEKLLPNLFNLAEEDEDVQEKSK
jgi:hypothetical protein